MTDTIRNKIRLSLADGFGPKATHYILETLQTQGISLADLFALSENEFAEHFPILGKSHYSRATYAKLQDASEDKLQELIELLHSQRIYTIDRESSAYPKHVCSLLQTEAPDFFYYCGNISLCRQQGVAIIGARDTEYELLGQAHSIASEISSRGETIISGYANGVDSAAHIGALEAGGSTVAVLSMGLLAKPMRERHELWNESNSLFISQFHPTYTFNTMQAMERNRIIIALSKAVIVIASNHMNEGLQKRSGTFSAASIALRFGIPLYVLQNSLTPKGNEELITMGGVGFEAATEIAL